MWRLLRLALQDIIQASSQASKFCVKWTSGTFKTQRRSEATPSLKCPSFLKGTPAPWFWGIQGGATGKPTRRPQLPAPARPSPRWCGGGGAPDGGWGVSASTRTGPWRCSQVPEPSGVFSRAGCEAWKGPAAGPGVLCLPNKAWRESEQRGRTGLGTKARGGPVLGKYSSVGLNWYAQPLKPRAGRSQGMKALQRALCCIDPIPSQREAAQGRGAKGKGGGARESAGAVSRRLGTVLRNEGISQSERRPSRWSKSWNPRGSWVSVGSGQAVGSATTKMLSVLLGSSCEFCGALPSPAACCGSGDADDFGATPCHATLHTDPAPTYSIWHCLMVGGRQTLNGRGKDACGSTRWVSVPLGLV